MEFERFADFLNQRRMVQEGRASFYQIWVEKWWNFCQAGKKLMNGDSLDEFLKTLDSLGGSSSAKANL
jgi:hypothetical protein